MLGCSLDLRCCRPHTLVGAYRLLPDSLDGQAGQGPSCAEPPTPLRRR